MMRQQIDAAPAPVTVSGQSRRERIVFSSLTKTFDGTTALDAVSFTVRRGEIHALLGANGAGKSTLIKLLAGFYQPDGGRIDVHDDADGSRHGIGFIHQDLALIPDLTVAENIALVCGYPRRGRGIDWRAVRAQAVAALELVSGGIDIDAKVDQLGRADQSVVAIARALYTNCAAIVLDEPTASLPDADVSRLFTILSRLRSEGVSVVYVTHRLDEVRKIADWVTVLRDGRVVADRSIEDFSDADIVREIVGGVVMPHQKSGGAHPAGPILRLAPGQMTEETAEFGVEVYAGEILGLAGLRGSGHEEVGRAIAGVRPLHMAHFEIDGAPVALSGVQAALHERIGFATSRREQEA
jgi:ribose transport system ATP-binding protein